MAGGEDRQGRTLSVRSRLIGAVLVLVSVGLALAGLTAYQLERSNLGREATARLARESEDLATLAAGVDPRTGQPFPDPRSLLEAAIQQRALAESDGVLGVVGGRVVWTAADGVPVRPEEDAQLVAVVLPLEKESVSTGGRLVTAGHDWLYQVTPVRVAGSPATGALVRVTDLRLRLAQLNATFATYSLVATGIALLATALTGVLAGRLLEPLTWVRRTAEAITEEDLTRRIPVRGRDDLAALTRTVNGMLDRVESSVVTQRRLLDDVGHELKTPLTILRGHLELLDLDDPEEVARTRDLALDEVERMGHLTEELLLLAHAQRVDFVRPRAVDLTALTDDVFERARGLAVRPWRLESLAEGRAFLDPERLTQAWLQLADNAAKYSPDASPIGFGSAVRGGDLWCWVADRGIGIAAEDRDRIMERFGRSARPEAQLRGGVGLGLAIVNTIAQAHGGRVDVRSSLGEGSTFSLVIPLRHAAVEEDDDADPDR